MHRSTLVSILAAILCGLVAVSSLEAQDLPIAVVDMTRAFRAHPVTKAAEERLEKSRLNAKKELDAKNIELKDLLHEHNEIVRQVRDAGLGDEAGAQKRKEAAALVEKAKILEREVALFQSQQEASLKQAVIDERREIIDEIAGAVKELNKDGKYRLILDSSLVAPNGIPLVLDARDVDDLTDRVIEAVRVPKVRKVNKEG